MKGLCIVLLFLLTACSLPNKPAEKVIQQTIKEKLDGEITWWDGDQPPPEVRQKVTELLSDEVRLADAIQIALLNSKKVQIILTELGENHARSMQTALLSNPALDATFINGSEIRQEYEVTWSFTSLFTLPARQDQADAMFDRSQKQAIESLYDFTYEVNRQWFKVVYLKQKLGIESLSLEAIEATYKSTEEIYGAGNTSLLELNASKIDHQLTDIRFGLLHNRYVSEKEQLAILLGVDVDALSVPDFLPKLPIIALNVPDIDTQVINNNLRLQALKNSETALVSALSEQQTKRTFRDLEAGPVVDIDGGTTDYGATLEYEIPIINTGGTYRAELRHSLRKNRLMQAQVTLELQRTVKKAQRNLKIARETVDTLLTEVTPAQIELETESFKFYNAMQFGIFKLLNYYRQGNERRMGFVSMLHQYWLARSQLEALVLGINPQSSMEPEVTEGVAANTEGEH